MILDGDAISALVTGTRFFSFPRIPLIINKNGGLGLLNVDYALESQLSDNGREVRLIRTLLDTDVFKGIGVDGNTALIVADPLTRPVGTVSHSSSLINHMEKRFELLITSVIFSDQRLLPQQDL